MMSSSTLKMKDMRVKIAPQHKGIYDALKNCAVGDFHELFFLCVCVGHKNGSREPLKKQEDCFWARTMSENEWHAYYAIHLHDHEMDLACLSDDEKVIAAMQEYANAGMAFLLREFLDDYTKKDSSGNYVVDHLAELPRELLVKLTLDWSS